MPAQRRRRAGDRSPRDPALRRAAPAAPAAARAAAVARPALVGGAAALLLASQLAGCGSGPTGTGSSAAPSGAWVEEAVSFDAGGVTVHGTFRHPAGGAAVPAALLIAGSGPTDRDGNSPEVPGQAGTLSALARWLSDDGVASLRYDKLGSGQTGLGPYRGRAGEIGAGVFEEEAAAALGDLARRPGVDAARLMVVGHSEGALFALLLATGAAGSVPPIHALALIEPLSLRYLDVISEQVTSQLAAAEQAGQVSAAQAAQTRDALARAVASLRSSATVPPDLPASLARIFTPAANHYLADADRHDPAELAGRLGARLPVLVSCSDADIQVSCADVDHLVAGLSRAQAATDLVRLSGVSHVLKEDGSRTAAGYGAALPFSSQLRDALRRFVQAPGSTLTP